MATLTIGVTGHRALDLEKEQKIRPVLGRAMSEIIAGKKTGDASASFRALSALAEGADILFAEVAREMGIHLTVILPFQKEEYLKTFSTDEKRDKFKKIYDAVDDRTYLREYNESQINDLYLNVGTEMVDRSDYVVAIWNEKAAKGRGGTAEVVAYALQRGKTVIVINPEEDHPFAKYL